MPSDATPTPAVAPVPVLPKAHEIRHAFSTALDPAQQRALLSWLSFSVTFGTVRGITHSIKSARGPFRNLSLGGEHLHHYMWGIGLLAGIGGVAVRGTDKRVQHPTVALAYGVGLALIVDEFALLLDLRDVYWAKEGRISVDLGVGGIGLVGSTLAGLPVAHHLTRRARQERALARAQAAQPK